MQRLRGQGHEVRPVLVPCERERAPDKQRPCRVQAELDLAFAAELPEPRAQNIPSTSRTGRAYVVSVSENDARNGESVYTSSRASGTAAAAPPRCSFIGYVTLPANEIQ